MSNKVDEVLLDIEAWRSGRLWGAKRIASVAGRSPETVYRWADIPECPVKRVGGQLFVMRDALIEWMTGAKAA